MRIVRGTGNLDMAQPIGSIALGCFDGVHKGHQKIIAHTVQKAVALGLPSAVLSFEPHPLSTIEPARNPRLLTPFGCKAELIKNMGIDLFIVLRFTSELGRTDAYSFTQETIATKLQVRHVTVGYNYRFGYKGEGTPDKLCHWGQDMGFGVSVLSAVLYEGRPISSSGIRKSINQGRIREASLALGRWPQIVGRVIRGAGRGRTLGFPTANINLREELVWPLFAVYAIRCFYDNEYVYGVANIGKAPTFDGIPARLEAHFFDFNKDLYGKKLSIELMEFLRPERKFSNISDLQKQIESDMEQARHYFEITAVIPMDETAVSFTITEVCDTLSS